MTGKWFTAIEAARLADASVAEVLAAIKDGILVADTGGGPEPRIAEEELAAWLKRSRRMNDLLRARKHKILLLGHDVASPEGTLKFELARDPRVDVRCAAWGRDGAMLVRNYAPALYVVELGPSLLVSDEALKAVIRSRAVAKASLVVYSFRSRDELQHDPAAMEVLNALFPDEFVSRAEGLRWLTIKCFVLLGLDTNTQVLRRQPPSPGFP